MTNDREILKKTAEEIEAYYKKKFAYESKYRERRNEQIERAKHKTNAEKKARKQRREQTLEQLSGK